MTTVAFFGMSDEVDFRSPLGQSINQYSFIKGMPERRPVAAANSLS